VSRTRLVIQCILFLQRMAQVFRCDKMYTLLIKLYSHSYSGIYDDCVKKALWHAVSSGCKLMIYPTDMEGNC
jgi:hypothetical protein